jgi:short-subunit dehydrogenase
MVSQTSTGPVSGHSPSTVAWIVGVGPSAGLGAVLGRRFAKEGLTVALTGRNTERLRSVAAEISGAGGHAHALAGDVSSAADVERLTAEVKALGGV